jgi:putative ATP-dependent endonuclease of the OLD family
MFLESMKIAGYKNFREEFTVHFSKGLNVLVGENGVGKSAIIDAIRLVLLEDEFGRRGISESDFHRPFQENATAADAIHIQVQFVDLYREQMVAFLPWSDLKGNAKLNLDVDNKQNNQGHFRPLRWGGASRASAFEWELFDTINCIYLPPLRDAEAKLREGRGSRLARLLRNLNKDDERQKDIETHVKKFHDDLAIHKSGPIAQANNIIRERLREALGTVFGQDTSIRFSETNFNRIAESLRLLFFPKIDFTSNQDLFRNLEENSLGYNNLIYLATVLAELTSPSEDAEYLRVLLIEEPEAHLHPQLQVRLLRYLENTTTDSGVQVIVTTHSPVLASAVSLKSIIHLSSPNDASPRAVPISNCGLSDKSEAFLSRWLDVTKSTLLFAKGIILVEGIAESMLIPELAKFVLEEHNSKLAEKSRERLPCTLEDSAVSVINMNGIFFKHFMQLFCNLDGTTGTNLPVRCAGITDQDPSRDSKPTPSKKGSGTNPALELIGRINGSEWARLYANDLKTFEYDLAFDGNNTKVMAKLSNFRLSFCMWHVEKYLKISKLSSFFS